jgi:predicted aldo/keto reductase-like oxidoreductase
MKSNAIGQITKNEIASIDECLRFSLSQDIHTLVSGVETVEQLEQNVGTVKAFHKLSPGEVSEILKRTKQGQFGSRIERYKKPEAGAMHGIHHDGEQA